MMPMGGMMAPGGGSTGDDRRARAKKLVLPQKPHTESVTGKVSEDRIAVSATAKRPSEPAPPDDDPQNPRPIIRRITTPKDAT
jgi:hypothetical protein